MKIDLHTHSTASDGSYRPAEVVRLAKEGGLKAIALTDHDSVLGIDEAVTFFTKVGQTIAITEMEAWKFIEQGDDLATWGRQRFRRLDTGHEWESEFAHIITLRDGRWLHFRDFMNSALTLKAFSGPAA